VTRDETDRTPSPVGGVRAAIAAITVATFAGAAAVTEAALAGMDWPLRVGTLVVLSVGIGSLVRIGLAQPLADAAVGEQRRRLAVEAELDELRDLDDLLAQVDGVLAMCTSQPDVLRALGRAVTAMLPERDNALLLCSSSGHGVVWRADMSADGLGDPEPVHAPGGCLALTSGDLVALETTSRFDACPHAAADDLAVSSVCLPVAARSTIGVVWSTGPTGDLPSPAALAALRRLATAVGHRLVAVSAPSAPPADVAPTPAPGRDLRDPLTGLPNHVGAHHLIRDLVESLTPFSLALCNVDGFGEYNTRHGRDGGDVALQTLSTVLTETLRPDDIVCRYGGDTFLAVFPNCSTMNAAAAMERVREALVLRLAGDGQPAFTCSSGIADSNQGTSVDELLEAADLAMSMAKYDGGSRVRTASFDAEPGEPDEPADRGAELG
jgi:diguanylate cyclase (GGDEF)-like protein